MEGIIIVAIIIWGFVIWTSHLEKVENQVLEDFQKKYDLNNKIERLKQKLEARNKEFEHVKKEALSPKSDLIEDFDDFIKPYKCTQCEKGNFKEKYGAYGFFFACTNYPDCKNTAAVNRIKKEYKRSIITKFLEDMGKAYN